MNLGFGGKMLRFDKGPVVDERNRVLDVVTLQRKELAHGLDGDKDPRIGSVISILSDLGKDSNHVDAHAVQKHGRTDRRTAGKDVLQQLPTDNCDTPMLAVVLFVQ